MKKNEKLEKMIVGQLEATSAHLAHNKQSCIAATVGFGKAKIAIDRIVTYSKGDNIVFTAPRELHLENFKKELIKFGHEDWIKHIHFCCVASLKNYKEIAKFIGIDECHLDNERSSDFVKLQLKRNFNVEILALSGTPGTEKTNELLKILSISYSKFTDDAVDDKMLNDYQINVIYHDLSDDPYSCEINTKRGSFKQSEKNRYDYLFEKYKTIVSFKKFPWELMAIKQFFGNLISKEDVTNFILNKIQHKGKVLVYCGSIEQTNSFFYPSYHSKLTKELRTANFESFESGAINILTNVNGIKEAVSITALKYGIIMKIDASKNGFQQILGRLLRMSIGETSHLYVLVARGTIEESWFDKASSSLDQTKIKKYNYKNLT